MSDKKPKGSLLGEVVFDGNDYSDEEKYEKAFNELLISTLKTLVIAGMSFEGPSMKLRTKNTNPMGDLVMTITVDTRTEPVSTEVEQ
jgi:hypothetical protein